MEDDRIRERSFARDEQALCETQEKYGKYCLHVAKNILQNEEDAKECCNDVYYKLWRSIPPERPENLKAYIGTTARRSALDRYRCGSKEEARFPRIREALEELYDCLPTQTEDPAEQLVRSETVNGFLALLKAKERQVFMRRYYYLCSISEIAQACGMREGAVKMCLLRTRNKLKAYLKKEGY